MPVRIVMRGLIGMIINRDENNPEQGTITAHLIDGSRALEQAVDDSIAKYKGRPEPHPDFENCMMMHKTHHKHRGEMQVFDGAPGRDAAGLVPLEEEEREISITVDEENRNYVKTELSYDKFMPKIGKIADNVKLNWSGEIDRTFISHTVTINRGVVRVRDVGDWDAGSNLIPEKFRVPEDSDAVFQAAKVRFLKANVYGYVATECVVDIPDTKHVTIAGSNALAGQYVGNRNASQRAAEDTVEILITNYAPQQNIPVPWTLHYRWMFEAAGYNVPIKLGGREFDRLSRFGKDYDLESWVCESEMFLGPDGKTGYPFPYRTPSMWRVPLGDLDYGAEFDDEGPAIAKAEGRELLPADPWDPIACPMGDLSPHK